MHMLPEKKEDWDNRKEADLRGWNRKDRHFNLDVLGSKVCF